MIKIKGIAMIASISGRLVTVQDLKLIIEMAGIGFELSCPAAARMQADQNIRLYTYLHWSAEQGPSLFGFETLLEKDLFLQLIDCPGVGPKLAISIMQQRQTTDLITLIASANASGLSTLKGLGAKKAEVICAHLKDKVNNLLLIHPSAVQHQDLSVWKDLQDTLQSLHYSNSEIRQATVMVKESVSGQQISFELLLRKTLQILAKK